MLWSWDHVSGSCKGSLEKGTPKTEDLVVSRISKNQDAPGNTHHMPCGIESLFPQNHLSSGWEQNILTKHLYRDCQEYNWNNYTQVFYKHLVILLNHEYPYWNDHTVICHEIRHCAVCSSRKPMIMTPWAISDLISTSINDFTILRIKQDNMWKTGGLALASVKKQNTGLSLANSEQC